MLPHTALILFFFLHFTGRALSPAQSEDSGLAADRGTTYATISIPRQNAQSMGIVFAGKIYLCYAHSLATLLPYTHTFF